MTKEEFKNLTKEKRYLLLKDLGKFLANRKFEGFIVSLFEFEGFYVEVWKRIGLDYFEYIEVVNDPEILQKYLEDFNPRHLLGDDPE